MCFRVVLLLLFCQRALSSIIITENLIPPGILGDEYDIYHYETGRIPLTNGPEVIREGDQVEFVLSFGGGRALQVTALQNNFYRSFGSIGIELSLYARGLAGVSTITDSFGTSRLLGVTGADIPVEQTFLQSRTSTSHQPRLRVVKLLLVGSRGGSDLIWDEMFQFTGISYALTVSDLNMPSIEFDSYELSISTSDLLGVTSFGVVTIVPEPTYLSFLGLFLGFPIFRRSRTRY